MEHEYKHLNIWVEAISLCDRIYVLSKSYPKDERYGLTNQIRRSAVSIPSNIAEGSASGSNEHFSRYINIALASLCELETQLYISFNLNYLNEIEFASTIKKTDSLKRMILSFRKKILNK